MTAPASHTPAYLRRLDEKLDRLHGEVGERFDRVEGGLDRMDGRLSRIEDELLVLTALPCVWKGERSRPRA
jgi:hypothetical protein